MKIQKKDLIIAFTFLLLGSFISMIISFIGEISLAEGCILSIVLSTAATLIEHKYNTEQENILLREKIEEIESLLQFAVTRLKFEQQIQETEHPYFRNWIRKSVDDFINDNAVFLNGTKITSPHKEDTFGIEGIKYTKSRGCLKAVSSVDDYWEDSFTKHYLDLQKQLINEKQVEITRIFIFPNEAIKNRKCGLMYQQYKCGVQVYYIQLDSPFVNPTWKNEDFLIQDDELVVEITCKSHSFEASKDACERITVVPAEVHKKIVCFDRMLERATKYTPNQHFLKAVRHTPKFSKR